MDIGHWTCDFEFDPADWYGFVYRIVDTTNDMHYIGKKQFQTVNRKIVKNSKRRKVVRKSSDWMRYTGSSDYLNAMIKEKGKDNFIFMIESLHETKGSLYYAEIESQIFEDVLRARLISGDRKFYNRMIGNIKFLPPVATPNEIRCRIASHHRSLWENLLAAVPPNDKSARMTGNANPMYGKRCDYRMSDAQKQEWKTNISKATKGLLKSDATKKKMSKPKGSQTQITCDVCGTVGGKNNMTRYHFGNCRKRPAH